MDVAQWVEFDDDDVTGNGWTEFDDVNMLGVD